MSADNNTQIQVKLLAENRVKIRVEELFTALSVSRQRVVLVLRGKRDWCRAMMQIIPGESTPVVFSDSAEIPGAISFSRAQSILGREAGCVVYDRFSGLNADVLCLAAGLVRSGGAYVLLTPHENADIDDPYGCWQDTRAERARFVEYLEGQFNGNPAVIEWNQYEEPPAIPDLPHAALTSIDDGVSEEQKKILAQLDDWLRSDIPCYVLTADRGRGKSTTLGLFAGRQAAFREMVVTADSAKQASVLLEVAESGRPDLRFIAPDAIVAGNRRIPLLLIDEAAMLPHNLLWQCIERADKILMATTTGGYEGTGQGFLLRFLDRLEEKGYRQGTIRNPVRWGRGDLLEALLNDALFLNMPVLAAGEGLEPVEIAEIGRDELSVDWNLLESVYRLLVSAHYRTRPSDLRQLMEDENQRLLVARSGGRVVGVLLLNLEGGFDSELCEEVFMGRRRPRGHLFAQMITAQAGLREFATASGYRVQRIAVAETCRRRGVGHALIQAARDNLSTESLDYIGASFALDADTALFWKALGFRCVHIGSGRGKSTGRKTLAVIQAASDDIAQSVNRLVERFQSNFDTWLLTYCNDLLWTDVLVLIEWLGNETTPLEALEEDEVLAFSEGFRGLDLSRVALSRLLLAVLADKPLADRDRLRLLVEKILLNRDWSWFNETGPGGKKKVLRELRGGIAECYRYYRLKHHD